MKRVLFFSILFAVGTLHAQDILKKYGYNKEPLTLSKGRYKETFINENVMQIGTVLIDTRTYKVVKFLEEDATEVSYKAENTSRFLTMDPLAGKFPQQSPYVYCGNNPVNAVDPTGMDYYYMSDKGYMVLALKTDDKFDRVYAFNTDKNGNTKASTVDINDRELLPQFTGGLENGGHSAITSNSTDAFNLFKFAVDNSNVEWSLSGFKNSEGITNFTFNTTHSETEITNINLFGNERSDLIFDVHSHPGTAGYSKEASGYDLYLNGLKNGSSDAERMNTYYNAAKAANKQWPSAYPKLFIYHKETMGLYNYNHKSPSVYVGGAKTPSLMRSLIRNYRLQP